MGERTACKDPRWSLRHLPGAYPFPALHLALLNRSVAPGSVGAARTKLTRKSAHPCLQQQNLHRQPNLHHQQKAHLEVPDAHNPLARGLLVPCPGCELSWSDLSVAEPPNGRVVRRTSEMIPESQSVAATNSTRLDMLTENLESTGNSGRSPQRKRRSHYIPREHHLAETGPAEHTLAEADEPVSSDAQPTIAPAAFEQARRNSLIATRKRRSHYIPREHGQPASPAALPPITAAAPSCRCKIAGAGGVYRGKDFLELDGTTVSRIQGDSTFQLQVSGSAAVNEMLMMPVLYTGQQHYANGVLCSQRTRRDEQTEPG